MDFSDERILTQEELKKLIESLAKIIDAPEMYLPTFDFVKGDGTPYVIIKNTGYNYINSERGIESKRQTTYFLDELIFWIFDSVTFQMSCDYEVQNRIENIDSRITLYKHQIELLYKINPLYSEIVEDKTSKFLGKDWKNN